MRSLPALGQGFSFYEYYSPEVYGPNGEKGHPQNWAIALDENGYLHFGNGSGVLTFDGVNWYSNHVGESGRVVSIFNSSDGQVYVNGATNFGKIVPDSLNRVVYTSISDQFFGPNESQPYIWETFEIGEYLYHRHITGIVKYHPAQNSLTDYPLGDERLSFSSFRMGDSIIVDAESGLWVFKDSLYHKIPGTEIFRDQVLQFGLQLNEESYLLGSRNAGQSFRESYLWFFDGEQITPFSSEANEYLKNNFLFDAIRVNDETIAIATIYGGVVFINNEGVILKIFTERTGLHSNSVYSLFLDDENMLWMGLAEGIQKLSLNKGVIHYSEEAGIKGSVNDIMVSGDDIYVYVYPSIYTNVLLWPEKIQSFQEIEFEGQIGGFVSWNNEAYVYGETGIYRLNKMNDHDQIYNESVLEYVQSSNNDSMLTFVGKNKLIHIDGNSFREDPISFSHDIGYAVQFENDIYVTLGDKTGAKKIAKITEDGWSIIPVNFDSSKVITFIEMGIINGQLYVGAEGGGKNSGLYELDLKQKIFHKSDFMADHPDFNGKQIFNFQQCSNSEVWFTANKNTYKVSEENGAWVAKASPYQLIGKNTIYDMECTEEGVWMSSTNNLFFVSNEEWDYQTSFQTNITGIYVDGDSLVYGGYKAPREPIILPYEDNELRFTFAAASYISPQNNRYQVKLEGFDEDWSNWNSESQKDYTNIPEGKYTFKVRGQNVYQVEGLIDSIDFEILPPWYRTWWAYLLYTITITGFLYLVYRIRINQILRVQRIRNNIASDLHDEVSATLSSISYFAQAIKSDKFQGDKTRFVNLIANSAGDAKEKITDIVWAINPEHDDWQNFLSKCRRYASDLLESKEINYSLKIDEYIPGKLDMQLRQHLWLIYKEMITNAVRHSGAINLDVILKYKEGNLELVVQDDGTGMDVDKVRKGNGLVNINKRADLIGAKITLKTSEGFGTRWKLKVPL